MVEVVLSIEPDLCGPFSVGTVGVIRLLSRELDLELFEACEYVNRCVFDGETVVIPAPSEASARKVVDLLTRHPRTSAHLRGA
jgi:hypothetical protein